MLQFKAQKPQATYSDGKAGEVLVEANNTQEANVIKQLKHRKL